MSPRRSTSAWSALVTLLLAACTERSSPPAAPPPSEEDAGTKVVACTPDAPWTPPSPPPPAPAHQGRCTSDAIGKLAQACAWNIASPTSACTDARAADPGCSDCIFGQRQDAAWRVVVADPAAGTADYNQFGCVEWVTGVPGCGASYERISSCVEASCGACPAGEFQACNAQVLAGRCAPHALTGACKSAYDANRRSISELCFPVGVDDPATLALLFVNLAKLACLE